MWERLRNAREDYRLRQEDLATKIQIEGVMLEWDGISRIELGTRFVYDFELMIFARVLGALADWLLGI